MFSCETWYAVQGCHAHFCSERCFLSNIKWYVIGDGRVLKNPFLDMRYLTESRMLAHGHDYLLQGVESSMQHLQNNCIAGKIRL